MRRIAGRRITWRQIMFWRKKSSASDTSSLKKTRAAMPLRRIFIAASLLLVGSTGLGLFWQRSALKAELLDLSAKAGLRVEMLVIDGRNHTSDAEIVSALGLTNGAPILALDLEQLRAAVEKIGWIRTARIERYLPQKLRIIVDERLPMALLQQTKGAEGKTEGTDGHVLIDRTGAVIHGADPSAFAHLPVVSGKNAPQKAALLLDVLKTEPELFSDVWAIQLISGRRWDVHLRSGIAIRLPERDPGLAWSRLARIERQSSITARDVSAIDLRIPGQLIVEPNIPVRGSGQKT